MALHVEGGGKEEEEKVHNMVGSGVGTCRVVGVQGGGVVSLVCWWKINI